MSYYNQDKLIELENENTLLKAKLADAAVGMVPQPIYPSDETAKNVGGGYEIGTIPVSIDGQQSPRPAHLTRRERND